MRNTLYLKWFIGLWLIGAAAQAAEVLQLQKVTDDVYAIVGPFGNRTPEKIGNKTLPSALW
jgi:hypothetical protein